LIDLLYKLAFVTLWQTKANAYYRASPHNNTGAKPNAQPRCVVVDSASYKSVTKVMEFKISFLKKTTNKKKVDKNRHFRHSSMGFWFLLYNHDQ
jgi:hypothetical protein